MRSCTPCGPPPCIHILILTRYNFNPRYLKFQVALLPACLLANRIRHTNIKTAKLEKTL